MDQKQKCTKCSLKHGFAKSQGVSAWGTRENPGEGQPAPNARVTQNCTTCFRSLSPKPTSTAVTWCRGSVTPRRGIGTLRQTIHMSIEQRIRRTMADLRVPRTATDTRATQHGWTRVPSTARVCDHTNTCKTERCIRSNTICIKLIEPPMIKQLSCQHHL